MKTGIELIAEEKEKFLNSEWIIRIVSDILLKKAFQSLFIDTAENDFHIKRLTFLGALIAAEIDRLNQTPQ